MILCVIDAAARILLLFGPSPLRHGRYLSDEREFGEGVVGPARQPARQAVCKHGQYV